MKVPSCSLCNWNTEKSRLLGATVMYHQMSWANTSINSHSGIYIWLADLSRSAIVPHQMNSERLYVSSSSSLSLFFPHSLLLVTWVFTQYAFVIIWVMGVLPLGPQIGLLTVTDGNEDDLVYSKWNDNTSTLPLGPRLHARQRCYAKATEHSPV